MVVPRTRYARSGEVHIAYQVVGEGPRDLVFVPGFMSHVENQWHDRLVASFFARLAEFSRLILFDKRGTGMSDPVAGAPTLEQRMDDVRAVMDAAGSEQAALLGFSEGGPMSALFAATYPHRTSALVLVLVLVLVGSFARGRGSSPTRGAFSDQMMRQLDAVVDAGRWGEGETLRLFAPGLAADAGKRARFGAVERASMSPGMARSLGRLNTQIDVSDVLPTIRVPTLVIHRTHEFVPIEGARELARAIPDARLVELPGNVHLPWLDDPGTILAEIEAFLTGEAPKPRLDRVLATVLFTDIVGSTQRAAELGDRRWRELLEQHEADARRLIDEHGGRFVKSTGDGLLASFDGPGRAIAAADAVLGAAGDAGLELRAGLHTGECELLGEDLAGIAVHIAARVLAHAGSGEVVVSRTVADLVAGSALRFDPLGAKTLAGVPGSWELMRAVVNDRQAA